MRKPPILAAVILILLATAASARNRKRSFEFDEMRRTYRVHVPAIYDDSTQVPLLINVHGYSANAALHRHMSQMNAKANEEGFIVVYPNGTGWPRAWNAGNRLGKHKRRETDDVGFLSVLIDTMIAGYQIDTMRIYAAGFSNGAMMSHRLACELADRIAAIGTVAGGLVFENCQPERPVPIIAFHARHDPVVAYDGDTLGKVFLYSIEDGMKKWAQINGCAHGPDSLYTEDGKVLRQRWWDDDSDMEVILWTTKKIKHSWPSGRGKPAPSAAFPSRVINANDLMWEFFLAHPLSEE